MQFKQSSRLSRLATALVVPLVLVAQFAFASDHGTRKLRIVGSTHQLTNKLEQASPAKPVQLLLVFRTTKYRQLWEVLYFLQAEHPGLIFREVQGGLGSMNNVMIGVRIISPQPVKAFIEFVSQPAAEFNLQSVAVAE